MLVTKRLKALGTRLRLERLEERCLLAGAITEFPVTTPSSGAYGITSGPDGNLWFTEQTADKIGRISTTGKSLVEFPLPTPNSDPTEIVTGPDGNLWFTEESGNKIGRISTTGTSITEFPVPTLSSAPFGITVGPDGALWFTEQSADKIGRITTSGTFTEFTIPTLSSEPTEIVAGPDGNLWFTEQTGNKIGRITPGGAVTEFPIPTASSAPFGITVGPDNNLWFTEMSGDKIAKITTAGNITEYALPTTGSAPLGITAGPDGNLWFTEQTGNKIGTITTSGSGITEFPVLTTGAEPTKIVTGSDGNLWFTEMTGNNIGRITPTTTATSPPPPTTTSPPPPTTTSPPPPSPFNTNPNPFGIPQPVALGPFPTVKNSSEIGVEQPEGDGAAMVSLDSNADGVIDTGDAMFTFGLATDTFVVGDWNDSGFDSVGVVRGTSSGVAQWSIDTNEDGAFDAGDSVFSFGLNNDKFVTGDWTGSGTTKIGVVQTLPNASAEWVLDTAGTGVFTPSDTVYNYGFGSDTPITGDWNGKGKTEIGIVRDTPSGELQWVLNTSGTGVFSSSDSVFNFGLNGDIPLVGDWNGEGKDEIGVERPQSNGTATFTLDVNGNGTYDGGDSVFAFGQSTDNFLIGMWKPPQALLAGDGVLNAPVQALQPNAQFVAVINQAIAAWEQAGITPQQTAQLENAHYSIGTLNNGLLGETNGNNIVIDATAQGHGWSESATPQPGQMDLFTTLEHEMGHVLGLPDQTTQPSDLMFESLLPGVRKTPTTQDVDAVFAGGLH
jgi:streptogramin lyase